MYHFSHFKHTVYWHEISDNALSRTYHHSSSHTTFSKKTLTSPYQPRDVGSALVSSPPWSSRNTAMEQAPHPWPDRLQPFLVPQQNFTVTLAGRQDALKASITSLWAGEGFFAFNLYSHKLSGVIIKSAMNGCRATAMMLSTEWPGLGDLFTTNKLMFVKLCKDMMTKYYHYE